jgi:Piwi domain
VPFDAVRFRPPYLRFDPAIPGRRSLQSYQGLRLHGPYNSQRVKLTEKSLLFVFPEDLRGLSRQVASVLAKGQGSFAGFQQMFNVELDTQTMYDSLAFEADLSDRAAAAAAYRKAIADWHGQPRTHQPKLAIVLVPHSERWEVEQPYYEAKASFAQLGIPTQMVTSELVSNPTQFGWAAANIALAAFAKLGGVPWTVEAPGDESDLVIGIGRADVRTSSGYERIFGYALSFIGNGVYRHTWAFQPVIDVEAYEARLESIVASALQDETHRDQPPKRLVVHLTRKTGKREIEAVQRAMSRTNVTLPTAFLRVDSTSLYDLADGSVQQTFGPPKGLAVRLTEQRMLLQSEEVSPAGAPDGPLLMELDHRSTVDAADLPALVEQAYRLAHANWRGFNARSQPVTVAYGELLARLAGYLEEVETWRPEFLPKELQERPWFL